MYSVVLGLTLTKIAGLFINVIVGLQDFACMHRHLVNDYKNNRTTTLTPWQCLCLAYLQTLHIRNRNFYHLNSQHY